MEKSIVRVTWFGGRRERKVIYLLSDIVLIYQVSKRRCQIGDWIYDIQIQEKYLS
jgi:hypothetical protein